MITIYTDGSARGNPGPGGWAAVIYDEDKVKEIGGFEEHTTNNRMELRAVIESVKSTSGNKITINTDSEYIVKGITSWIKGWQKNNWRTAARKPVLNKELWQELLEVAEGKDITWVVVRGHAGVFLNERCDVIATSFADGEPVKLYTGPVGGYKFS